MKSKNNDCCSLIAAPLPDAEPLAQICQALGEPTRLQILALIAAQGEAVCACDLVPRFQLSQPTLSHHLKVLKEAGLLDSARDGRWIRYSIAGDNYRLLQAFLNRLVGNEASAVAPSGSV